MNLSNRPWKNYGRWKQPPISGTFWTHWHEAQSAKEITRGGPVPHIIFLDGYHLTPEEEDTATKEYFSKAYEQGILGEFYNRLESASKRAEDRHLDLLNKDHFPVVEYLEELFDSYQEVVGSWGFLFRFSSSLEEMAREHGLAITDDEMLEKMRPYIRVTWLEQQSMGVRELAREFAATYSHATSEELTVALLEKDHSLSEKVRAHVKTFAWFGTHHWEGDGYTVQKCLDEMSDLLRKGDTGQEVTSVTQMRTDVDESEEIVWELLASSAYWRTHCAEVTAKGVFASRGRLEEVGQGWGMTYADLTYLSSREIIVAAKKDLTGIQLPENYAERRAGYGCLIENGEERIVTGKELATLIDEAVPKTDTSVKELLGVVASKGGVITGIAKVIFGPADFSRFTKGDILVANETTPDFVPLMKLAKAIVTDTGGITSHAAIVSRELKKPCVIGTKIATQVIKDGAEIEVDTQTGIIRIL